MNKVLSIMAICALLASCATKQSNNWADLSGEWEIINIEGTEITTTPQMQEHPFIGFDKEGQIYGYCGCNRLTGKVSTPEDPTIIDFSNIGITMMSCPDMTVETIIIETLKNVKTYRPLDENKMEFCDSEGNTKISLRKK